MAHKEPYERHIREVRSIDVDDPQTEAQKKIWVVKEFDTLESP